MEKILKGAKTLKEYTSPEGVEEKIIYEENFMITQTQGGKFRTYDKGLSLKIYNTEEGARKRISFVMGFAFVALRDINEARDMIIRCTESDRKNPNDG